MTRDYSAKINDDGVALSIVMPCRNEKNTVVLCVSEAQKLIKDLPEGSEGEVLVVDNGSDDGSGDVAGKAGARVVREEKIGYGNALRRGMSESLGEIIVMGDCDTTYPLERFMEMYRMMKEDGFDMVIGDRFAGGMEKGAMPFSHKVGVCFLSWLGRKRYHTDVRDFHSGLRGIRRDAFNQLTLRTEGMEFATEMIGEAAKHGMKIGQLPVKLRKCKYQRSSKLRTVRDGFRHLRVILRG